MKKRGISRRSVLKGSLMASVIGGTGCFFGPWKENRVWAQGAAKPIKLGLTCDASGQYGNSGQDDMRGILMAIDEVNAKGGVLGRKPAAVLGRFVAEAQSALVTLSESAHAREMDSATAILAKARDIYLLGLGGSFPVAIHLAYVLRKLGRRVMLLDGIGGSIHEQSHPAGPEDALVAISFRNYYPDTARLFPELVARGVPAISITDSLLSPIVEGAKVVFEIQDLPEPALRTLVAPMCLVQALAIGLDLAAD